MNDKRAEADVVSGPIEMRGYDALTLAVEHLAVLPDGRTLQIPAGTKLIMITGGGVGIRYATGTASKGVPWDYPPAPVA